MFGDIYLSGGDTDRREVLHDGRAITRADPLLVAISSGVSKCGVRKGAWVDHFWPLRFRFLPFDCEYLENGKTQRYMSKNMTSVGRELSKNVVTGR